MGAIFLWLLANVSVPNVTAGPNLAEETVLLEAPVDEVIVYSDRAKVKRRAQVSLKPGIQSFRLPDLPGAVLVDTIRMTCLDATILRVEAIPVERERYTIEQVEGMIEQLEALMDRIELLDHEVRVLSDEVNFYTRVTPSLPIPEAKRVGQPTPPQALPEVWRLAMDFFAERKSVTMARIRSLSLARQELQEKLVGLQKETGRFDLGAFSDRKIQVVALLEAQGPKQTQVELEYNIPGASWTPSYNVIFLPKEEKVVFQSAGMVQQASGEDWSTVALKLSTAIPGQSIDLPELLTWALGEKREFVPRAVAARMPQQAASWAQPTAIPSKAELARMSKLQVLQERLEEARLLLRKEVLLAKISNEKQQGQMVQTAEEKVVYKKKSVVNFEDDTISGNLARPDAQYLSARKSDRDGVALTPKPRASDGLMLELPSAPPPAERTVSERPEVAEKEEMTEEFSLLEENHSDKRVFASVTSGSTSSGKSMRVRSTSLGLFEPSGYRRPTFSDPSLPAVTAGGLDYQYACPTRMTVASDGKKIRVPLSTETYPVKAFYEATPSLLATAFLKATVSNKSDRPILMGPANIFLDKDFSGQGIIKTTGPGGIVEFPLGADEDIRLLRTVVPKTEIKGVFSKDEITTYEVTLEVGNYKKQPIRIALFDQVPKSNNEDIEIGLGSRVPAPNKGPDADGVMRWELDLPAGQTKKVQFSYSIKRPIHWQLHQ